MFRFIISFFYSVKGGAFIMYQNGRAFFRGIVSSAIFNRQKQECDNTKYAVFTDVSKFTPWILQNMNENENDN